MTLNFITLTAAVSLALASAASAATVNGTGNVTPDVIFGSGNANGSFTGVAANALELGLRAKLRYDLSGHPQNIFNYDGNHTYTFNPALSHAPTNRSVFNFEWAINSNVSGAGSALSGLVFKIDVDTDPTVNVGSLVSYNPLSAISTGYYLGTNASGNGGASFNSGGAGPLSVANVAQNSVNLGFLPGADLGNGQYTISLFAYLPGTRTPYASTSIDVIVGAPAAIPLPAGLPLLASALSGIALLRRRKRA